MEFKDKIVIVTGGAHGIGLCIVDEFRKAGATVCVRLRSGFIIVDHALDILAISPLVLLLKLYHKKDYILSMLESGASYRSIAADCHVDRKTLMRFLARFGGMEKGQ